MSVKIISVSLRSVNNKLSQSKWVQVKPPVINVKYINTQINNGSSTYYVISRGGGGFQMLTVDYGEGRLVVDH